MKNTPNRNHAKWVSTIHTRPVTQTVLTCSAAAVAAISVAAAAAPDGCGSTCHTSIHTFISFESAIRRGGIRSHGMTPSDTLTTTAGTLPAGSRYSL